MNACRRHFECDLERQSVAEVGILRDHTDEEIWSIVGDVALR